MKKLGDVREAFANVNWARFQEEVDVGSFQVWIIHGLDRASRALFLDRIPWLMSREPGITQFNEADSHTLADELRITKATRHYRYVSHRNRPFHLVLVSEWCEECQIGEFRRRIYNIHSTIPDTVVIASTSVRPEGLGNLDRPFGLQGLSFAEIALVMEQAIGAQSDASTSWIHTLTGGHPRLVEALVHALGQRRNRLMESANLRTLAGYVPQVLPILAEWLDDLPPPPIDPNDPNDFYHPGMPPATLWNLICARLGLSDVIDESDISAPRPWQVLLEAVQRILDEQRPGSIDPRSIYTRNRFLMALTLLAEAGVVAVDEERLTYRPASSLLRAYTANRVREQLFDLCMLHSTQGAYIKGENLLALGRHVFPVRQSADLSQDYDLLFLRHRLHGVSIRYYLTKYVPERTLAADSLRIAVADGLSRLDRIHRKIALSEQEPRVCSGHALIEHIRKVVESRRARGSLKRVRVDLQMTTASGRLLLGMWSAGHVNLEMLVVDQLLNLEFAAEQSDRNINLTISIENIDQKTETAIVFDNDGPEMSSKEAHGMFSAEHMQTGAECRIGQRHIRDYLHENQESVVSAAYVIVNNGQTLIKRLDAGDTVLDPAEHRDLPPSLARMPEGIYTRFALIFKGRPANQRIQSAGACRLIFVDNEDPTGRARELVQRLRESEHPMFDPVEIMGVHNAASALSSVGSDPSAFVGALIDVNLDEASGVLKRDGYRLARELHKTYELGVVMVSYHSGYARKGIPFLSKNELDNGSTATIMRTLTYALSVRPWTDPEDLEQWTPLRALSSQTFDHHHRPLWQRDLPWLTQEPQRYQKRLDTLLPDWLDHWIPQLIESCSDLFFVDEKTKHSIRQLIRRIATYSARLSVVVHAATRSDRMPDFVESIQKFVEELDGHEDADATLSELRALLDRPETPPPETPEED